MEGLAWHTEIGEGAIIPQRTSTGEAELIIGCCCGL